MPQLSLQILAGEYAVCRLSSGDPFPSWAADGPFLSLTRTDDELSIVCLASQVPGYVRHERDWSCLKLRGPFAFEETGILLAVIEPLSKAGIGIFALSTFDTDYVLVKTPNLDEAVALLRESGHSVDGGKP